MSQSEKTLADLNESQRLTGIFRISKSKLTNEAYARILNEFIKPEFDLNMLKVYFDNDGWSAVEELHKVKVRSCTCKKCTSICTESFITCTFCNTRIHYDCDSVNFYYRSGKGKQFKCSLCKSIKK